MNKIHEVKTWPEPFQAIIDGLKTFDVRLNDRHYELDDLLCHKEFDPVKGEYTGRTAVTNVKYVQPGGQFGVDSRCVVLSISLMMYDTTPAEQISFIVPENQISQAHSASTEMNGLK